MVQEFQIGGTSPARLRRIARFLTRAAAIATVVRPCKVLQM